MPSIVLTLYAEQPAIMPVYDQHIRQGVVYKLLRADRELSAQLHDKPSGERCVYKPFCFTPFLAEHRIYLGDKVALSGIVQFEIRSLDAHLISVMAQSAAGQDSINLGKTSLHIEAVQMKDTQLRSSTVKVRMLSPLALHYSVDGRNVYVGPDDEDFSDRVNRNFAGKWTAFHGEAPEDEVSLKSLSLLSERDRDTSVFKDTTVVGYYGDYELSGSPQALTMLYHVGLGERNAQGYGVFDILWQMDATRGCAWRA